MTAAAEAAWRGLRAKLMLAAVTEVASVGWTHAALDAGAGRIGLDRVDAARLYPGGPAELFRAFSDWADACMAAAIRASGGDAARLSARVEAAVLARFAALAPRREAVRRGIAFAALPGNGGLALACFGRTLDAVWRAAGDRSADFSYYTKRALLAGVLAATTLVWLDDRSPDGEITRAFLARRIADVLRLQEVRGRVERMARHLPDPFGPMAAGARRGPGGRRRRPAGRGTGPDPGEGGSV